MARVILPNIPDVTGTSVQNDVQLRNLLIAIKTTLEKLTNADKTTSNALVDLLNNE